VSPPRGYRLFFRRSTRPVSQFFPPWNFPDGSFHSPSFDCLLDAAVIGRGGFFFIPFFFLLQGALPSACKYPRAFVSVDFLFPRCKQASRAPRSLPYAFALTSAVSFSFLLRCVFPLTPPLFFIATLFLPSTRALLFLYS